MLAITHKMLSIMILNPMLLLFESFDSYAQPSISDEVSISVIATIVDSESISLNIITLQNLTIRPEDILAGENEIYVSPINAENAGLIFLKGNPNTGVNIYYQAEEFIYSINGDDYVKISYVMSGYEERNQQASTLFETNDVFIALNENGEYFLWIGGLINTGNAGAGLYSGDFVFEISNL